MTKMNRNRIPTLICFPGERNTVNAWCTSCKKFHYHGRTKSPNSKKGNLGHRNAHCPMGTGFEDTGYFLRLVPKYILKEATAFYSV